MNRRLTTDDLCPIKISSISEPNSSSAPSNVGSSSSARILFVGVFVFWCAGIGWGYSYTQQYENSPTATAIPFAHWPSSASCGLSSSQPTLVMFVHPQCPCSRASLEELAVLLQRCPKQLQVDVFFWQPAELQDAWKQSELWSAAAAMSGIRLWRDLDGVEKRRFGAQVSGEVFLYLPNGALAFHGGITPSRGQIGENRGRIAIESLLLGNGVPKATTPVFGCDLRSPQCRPMPL
jgi:hypothetical protein